MEAALRQHLSPLATWTSPTGGMFLWARLPEGVQVERVFQRALAAKVAFVSGEPFFADAAPAPFMRLNFSHRLEAVIAEGVRRLADVVRTEVAGRSARSDEAPALRV